MSEITDLRLIGKKELLELVPMGYSSVVRLMRQGRFPKPLRITKQRVAWREADVRAWLNGLEEQTYQGADAGEVW